VDGEVAGGRRHRSWRRPQDASADSCQGGGAIDLGADLLYTGPVSFCLGFGRLPSNFHRAASIRARRSSAPRARRSPLRSTAPPVPLRSRRRARSALGTPPAAPEPPRPPRPLPLPCQARRPCPSTAAPPPLHSHAPVHCPPPLHRRPLPLHGHARRPCTNRRRPCPARRPLHRPSPPPSSFR
jgi:hypothetical protein